MTFDFYADTEGKSSLHRLDARIKIICTLAVIFGVVMMSHWEIPLIVLGACLILLAYSHGPWKIYLRRLLYPSYIIILVAVVQPFMIESNVVGAHLPISGSPIYAAGLNFGILILTRCLAAIAALNLLLLLTPLEQILDSLRWFRVPNVIADTMMLMLRYISLMSEKSTRIRKAQESRLGYSKKVGVRKKIGNFGTLAGMLMARSFDRAIKVGDAMVSRCYTGTSNLFSYTTKKLPRKDSLIGLLAILGIVGLVLIDAFVV